MTEVTILAYGIENKHSSEVATARRYSGKDLGGRGVFKWADGPYYWYRGQFNADNLAHGYGAKEGYLYTAAGQWADGRMDGPCVLRYASGRTCYRLYERGVNVNCAWEWEDKESHAVTCKFDDLPCDASDVRLIHIKTAALQVEVPPRNTVKDSPPDCGHLDTRQHGILRSYAVCRRRANILGRIRFRRCTGEGPVGHRRDRLRVQSCVRLCATGAAGLLHIFEAGEEKWLLRVLTILDFAVAAYRHPAS